MRIAGFIWIVLALAFLVPACSQQTTSTTTSETVEEPEPEEDGDQVAVINTSEGNIVVRLLPGLAPKTVEQFVRLASSGFYIRTTFHFVTSGFILGGDPFSRDNNPENDGLGNARKWIDPEFNEAYEVKRGTVGMMRKDGDPNSSSCQFFVVLTDKPEWNGKYNIFGEVIEGIEVAEAISKAPTVRSNRKLANQPAAKQMIKRIELERRIFEDPVEEPEAEAAEEAKSGLCIPSGHEAAKSRPDGASFDRWTCAP